MFITASLIPFVMLCVNRYTQPDTPELLIVEQATENVQEGVDQSNVEKAGMTKYAKRTRNSVNGELVLVSSV